MAHLLEPKTRLLTMKTGLGQEEVQQLDTNRFVFEEEIINVPGIKRNPQPGGHKTVMTRTFTIANQKGGVGKTTTTVNLAAALAATKRRVLLIDMDPQGNATMGSGIDKNALRLSICDVLLGDATASQALLHTPEAGYDILPANADLTAAEVQLMNKIGREKQLSLAIDTLREHYDYILIDCPPSLNMLTVNALVAANGIVVPMQCEYYALEGLSSLLDTIEQIRISVNPDIRLEGLLRTMYDPRNNLSNDVSSELVEHFGDRVYRTVIPRNVALAEAPSHGQSILKYNKNSRGSMAYLALAGEVLRRGRQTKTITLINDHHEKKAFRQRTRIVNR